MRHDHAETCGIRHLSMMDEAAGPPNPETLINTSDLPAPSGGPGTNL